MFSKLIFVIIALCLTLDAREPLFPAIIFASANNKFVLPVVLEQFYQKYPKAQFLVKYGTSGDLTDAILNGADYDLFLAANSEYPQEVYAAKKAINPPVEYARGALILFTPQDSSLSQKKLTVLKNKNIKHITIANKASAPYGKAAVEALKNVKLFAKLKDKIRYSSDISTVIESVIWYDNAGFLSKSAVEYLPKAYRKEGINWIEVDSHLYHPIIQTYVISQSGAQDANVTQFLKFLHSQEGQKIYHKYGYR